MDKEKSSGTAKESCGCNGDCCGGACAINFPDEKTMEAEHDQNKNNRNN